jgi:hypothetical protein
MPPFRSLALVTYRGVPLLTEDDRRLIEPLFRRGISVQALRWDDPEIDWTEFDAVVLRSTWDYHLRINEFRGWLDALEREGVPLWNPPGAVFWNMDKNYLRDLARLGCNVPPSEFLEPGAKPDLLALMDSHGWSHAVIKPTVSASGYRTWTVERDGARGSQGELHRLLENAGALIQPFMDGIRAGEWSLVYFRGVYSHAFLKTPPSDSMFVHPEHGGRWQLLTPPAALVGQGSAMLRHAAIHLGMVTTDFLYARVDGILQGGELLLMELELIEPALMLEDDLSAERFADAVVDLIS